MKPGEALSLAGILPKGVTPEDFYTMLAGLAAFLCIYSIGRMFVDPDKLTPRLKALEDRRT